MYIPMVIIKIILYLLLLISLFFIFRFLFKKFYKKSIKIGNSQKKGNRKVQEDSFSTFENENGLMALVADGMGGLEHGKLASNTTVKLFVEEFTKEYEIKDLQKFLLNSAYRANEKVVNMFNGRKIGTTLVATIIKNKLLHWISIGDSRIYLYRKGELLKLNEEHTYEKTLNDMYENREIGRDDIIEHPKKDFLTSYIGYEEFHEIDYSKNPIPLNKDDSLVLMSDGIYKSLTEIELKQILKKRISTEKKCDLVTEIIEKKSIYNQDNMTIIIIEKV